MAPDAALGSKLQKPVTLILEQPAPDKGLDVVLKSGAPARLLISKSADQPGAESIIVHVKPGAHQSPEFWLQAIAGEGTATYTATAPGFGAGTGTVTLSQSAVVIMGPFRGAEFLTTTGAPPSKITLFAVRLDASSKFVEDQAVAGKLRVDISSSNPAAGTVAESHVEIPAGVSTAVTEFRPAGEGQTTLSAGVPSGFAMPAEFASIVASVKVPGLAISEQLAIGRNLQVAGVLSLGEAPMKGLKVTLVSDDPSRLLLSASENQVGSKSITVEFPAGEVSRRYYLQALGDSGTVQYTATAPGYRARTGTIILAPAGIVITPISQGPPDEAHVFRTEAPESSYKFMAELSKPTPINLVAWTVQLDPVTHRSADITVQPLRAGMSLTVPLMNSNPAVGTVDRQLTIAGGSDHAVGEFKPAKAGETHISVTTPKDFTMSANSTTVIGIVKN